VYRPLHFPGIRCEYVDCAVPYKTVM